ncbi:GNAT family N-acetyltransferase [Candidatus Riflebacteria bacterium]
MVEHESVTSVVEDYLITFFKEIDENPALLDFFYALNYLEANDFSVFRCKNEKAPILWINNKKDINILNLCLLSKALPLQWLRKKVTLPGLHILVANFTKELAEYFTFRKFHRFIILQNKFKKVKLQSGYRAIFEEELHECPGKRRFYNKMGVKLLKNGVCVSEASSQFSSQKYTEVAIETREDFRCRGYAAIALSLLLEWVFEQHRVPVYITDCKNHASLRLCKKLGFEFYDEFWELDENI